MRQPIRPLFRYYGSKWVLARRYPRPAENIEIVEPFAGSACFALHYWWHPVTLYDADPKIVELWRYLISADPTRILSLPDVFDGCDLRDFDVEPIERWLIGWWCGAGQYARNTFSGWAARHLAAQGDRCTRAWSAALRQRIADAVPLIRHWQVERLPYADVPNRDAYWFIDPPYEGRAGSYYTHGSKSIDYAHLGSWCRERMGQVVVCEHDDAAWLPFRVLTDRLSAGNAGPAAAGGRRSRHELVWTNDGERQGRLL
jgi:site-specific DNA-adenine methylase